MKQDPSNARWQRTLSVGYEKVGDVQLAQGDLAGALKSYRDEVALQERLAKQDPSNAGWQRTLSVGYEKAGNVQLAQGDLGGALQSYRDYLEIARKLAEQATDNAVWQNNAAWGRYCVAKVLVRIKGGDRNEARRLTNEGLDIMTRLEHQGALDANARDTLNKLNELARALVSSPRR